MTAWDIKAMIDAAVAGAFWGMILVYVWIGILETFAWLNRRRGR